MKTKQLLYKTQNVSLFQKNEQVVVDFLIR